MPLEYQQVALPMVGGVDTSTDPKAIAPPKLARLENGRFGKPGTIRKRNGYAVVAEKEAQSGASGVDVDITTARSLATRGDELVVLDEIGLATLMPEQGRWRRRSFTGGISALAPARVSMRQFPKTRQDQTGADRATAFGVTFCAYCADDGKVYLTATDATSGAALLQPSPLDSTAAARPRVVSIGSQVCVFWLREATGSLRVTTITGATLAHDLDAIVTASHAAVEVVADVDTTVPVWDAVAAAERILIAYNSSTATTIKFGYVLSNGALDGALSTQASAAAVSVLALARAGDLGVFCIAWGMNAGTNELHMRQFDADKTVRHNRRQVNVVATTYKAVTIAYANAVSPATTNGIRVDFYWEESAVATYNHKVQRSRWDGGGTVVTAATLAWRHVGLASRAWWTGADYRYTDVILVHESTLQTTYFGYRAGAMTARLLPGTAGGLVSNGHLPQVEELDDGRWATVLLERNSDGTSTYDRGLKDTGLDCGVVGYQTAEVGDVLLVAGGVLSAYDGISALEHGFPLFPENVTAASSAGGGLTASASYSYRVYFEYINAQGQREISTTGAAITKSTGVGEGTITLTIPTLGPTARQYSSQNTPYVSIVVYRTTANAAAPLIYHRVSSPDPSTLGSDNGFRANTNVANDTITFVDAVADSSITSAETDYLSSVPVELENVTPPASSLIAAGNNHVFLAGFEDPDSIWASKLRGFGEGLAFSDALTISAPPAEGPITALAVMGDELIVFRERHIYSVTGDGPNNTGTNGQWETPRVLSDDIGCVDARSLVQFPGGLMFKSRRGIYLLGRDHSLVNIGQDVAAYDGEEVVSAVAMRDVHEVRFLTANRCLVFEYLEKAWSVWTIGGKHAVLWQGQYAYLPGSSGETRVEAEDHFLDVTTPYKLIIETAWLPLAGRQGNQHVRHISVLGEYHSDHVALVSLAYNFESFWSDRQRWSPAEVIRTPLFGGGVTFGAGGTFGGNDASKRRYTGAYQFRLSPCRPECEAIKVRIEDTVRAGYPLGESCSLSEITLEVAPRGGVFRPGADKAAS